MPVNDISTPIAGPWRLSPGRTPALPGLSDVPLDLQSRLSANEVAVIVHDLVGGPPTAETISALLRHQGGHTSPGRDRSQSGRVSALRTGAAESWILLLSPRTPT